MCGLAGFIDLSQSVNFKATPDFVNFISQRGPDNISCVLNDNKRAKYISFNSESLSKGYNKLFYGHFHSRLTLTGGGVEGNQPFRSTNLQDNSIWTHNGQIYNHKKLRELLKDDYNFKSNSDSEIFGPLLWRYGVESLGLIEGQFALVHHDTSSKSITLSRDRYGQKPLYFIIKESILIYGSSVNILASLIDSLDINFEWKISDEGLVAYIQNDFIPPPLSLWKGLNRLMPGEVLVFDYSDKKFTAQLSDSIWNLKVQAKSKLKELTDPKTFKVLHEKFIEDATASDQNQRLAIGLSGGLDSTSIALATLKHKYRIDYLTLTASENSNEVNRIKQLSEHLDLPNIKYIKSCSPDPKNSLMNCFYFLSEPTFNLHDIMIRDMLYSKVNKTTRIFLSGGHADFMLANGGGFWEFFKNSSYFQRQSRTRQLIRRIKYKLAGRFPSVIHSFGFVLNTDSNTFCTLKHTPNARLYRSMNTAFGFIKPSSRLGNVAVARVLLERSYLMMLDDEIGLKYNLDVRDCFLNSKLSDFINQCGQMNIFGPTAIATGSYYVKQTDHKPLLRFYISSFSRQLSEWLHLIDKRSWGSALDKEQVSSAISNFKLEREVKTVYNYLRLKVAENIASVNDETQLSNRLYVLAAFISSKPFKVSIDPQ